MALKYYEAEEILLNETAHVTDSIDRWQSFLHTVSNNYKYNFHEQILIFGQRPNATACADMHFWNEKMGRWVNRGAEGIALFDDNNRKRLRYVFDVSDTNSFYGNEVKLWKVKEQYKDDIVRTLINSFGECADFEFESVIDDTARNLVEDNSLDYIDAIFDSKEDSFMEELDELTVGVATKNLLSSSIGFVIMERCGLNPRNFYDASDFSDLFNFNTPEVIGVIGNAVSDISEMALREIEETVKALQKDEKKKIRTFEFPKENEYDVDAIKNIEPERSNTYGEINLQDSRGLSDSEYQGERGGERDSAGQVRNDEENLSSEQQEASVQYDDTAWNDDAGTSRNRSESEADVGNIDVTDGKGTGSDGTAQGETPDDLGGNDEQYQGFGRGDSSPRSDLQLSNHDFNESTGIDYFHQDKEKNRILREYLSSHREEIADYLKTEDGQTSNGDFLIQYFSPEPFEIKLSDDLVGGLEAYSDVVRLYRGNRDNPEREAWYKYSMIESTIKGMIMLRQWSESDLMGLYSVEEQASIIEGKKSIQLYLPQEAIDYILTRGSGISESNLSIYRFFNENSNKQDRVNYLKNIYGTGGHSDAIPGSGYWEDHDAKGIRIRDWNKDYEKDYLMNWQQVEKRISQLISCDRYLNKKETEYYPEWLNKQEELELQWQIEAENKKILQTDPEEKIEKEYKYEFKVDDTVYIGADEYVISFIGEDKVLLFDVKYPIFTQEMGREEFETKVKENPTNEHLRVEVTKDEPVIEKEKSRILENYEAVKNDNKGILLYQLGDFYEVMGEDAKTVADVLDLVLTHRDDTPMCGFPVHRLEDFVEKLNDKGFDVTVSYLENDVRQEKTIVSMNDVDLPDEIIQTEDTIEQTEQDNEVIIPQWEQKPQEKTVVPVSSVRRDFRITDDNLGVGGMVDKFFKNKMAVHQLKKLESENRLANEVEQSILADYVGWGGLADYFDERNPRFEELKELLTPKEYTAARESTLTAFYTPPVVIKAIYKALENMGFESGNILEPSCGVGNFMGLLPDSMSKSKFYGVELDDISGRIARQLYQNANIEINGFENTPLPDSFFDVAIGNVPFGQFKVTDRKYDKNNWLIHDYFFGKTLDKVRPGGIIAFVTSSGTMDKKNPNVRKYIAQRAELLGAVRLPNNTFKANAGTEVVSDVIFLQKRDTIVNEEPSWVNVGTDENGFEINNYFIENPDMVLGNLEMESSQFGMSLTCVPHKDVELKDLLDTAIGNISAEIKEADLSDVGEKEDLTIPADFNVRNFSFTVVDGKVYYRENSRMRPVEVSSTAENRIKGMINIRDTVRNLIDMQMNDRSDYEISSEQEKLNKVYDEFTKKYGVINSRANNTAFSDDSSYSLLCSLEVIDEDGKLKRKADMFSKRTIKPHINITSVDTASEALAVSIGEKTKVDMEYMIELTGKTENEIFDELQGVIFLNPLYNGVTEQEKYLTADEYLSGNVREKLEWAKRSAELYPEDFNVNVVALEQVQPQELTASEISVRLGTTWIPCEDVASFMYELLQTPRYMQWNIKVHFSKFTSEWNIEGKSYDRMNVMANSTYGTDRINAYKIIEETLNLRDVRIFDYIEDENGNRKPVLNKKETAIAQGKQELIKEAFKNWIWNDPDRRQRLVNQYNVTFNSMRPREYDGSHINFSGINPEIKLREHQINAIARIIYGGNTLLAHVVGAGKTFEIVAAAQESKRLGLCNKSLIVVPNHLTEQWASEYLQLYPSANILVATKKDFETKNRKKFCARIATGDYDAVIIGHSQFEKIPVSLERQRDVLKKQIEEITDGIVEMQYNRGEKFTVKQLEKTKKTLQNKLDKLNDQTRKDDVITFEELGVDRLFVDEAHNFKNLYLYTKMRNVGGVAQTEAQKSSDLFMKCRYLDEITGGKGVIFATGTPVSNSMVELYTMQRYLQYSALQKNELQHFDAWASNFGETVTAIELAPEGTGYRSKTRFAKFYNLPELMIMFKQVADIQTSDMLKLPVPEAEYTNVAIKPSEIQKNMVASLSDRAERVRNRMVNSSIDNMLLITNDGRKLALDQRLTNEMLPDDPNGKVSVCAENVFKIWEDTAEQKSTQLVFCDLSTPHNDGKFNVYDDIKKKLISKGIPENEISFIHSADSEAKKKELFSKVRSGQVRVLIGSTAKMGAGTNVQDKLIALHHLDCPWRPADLQQREGRIIRQGNENPKVKIFTYVTEETFDAYLYQLVENKQKFIGQIMTSKSPVRSAEDVDEQALSYAEIKALATGNPYIKEKMDLDVSVAKLKLLKQNHLSQRYQLEDKLLKFFPAEIKRLTERIDGYESDIKTVEENTVLVEDGIPEMVIEGVTYTDKKEAGSAILAACKNMKSPEPIIIGSYRGMTLELSFEKFQKQYCMTMIGKLRHSTPLGADIYGNITRIDNVLASLPERKESTKMKLDDTVNQQNNAKEQITKEFPQEVELKAKSERLAELNALLDMDHKENEICDGEVSDDNPERKAVSIEER